MQTRQVYKVRLPAQPPRSFWSTELANYLTLEWLYFPALFFLLQWRAITAPYWNPSRHGERSRVTTMLLVRGVMFALLGWVSPKASLYQLSITMHSFQI